MKDWLKNFHEWSLNWANTKWGAWALFICAFADASCLPLPTPMFFLALSMINITKVFKYALFGTLGSLFGAIAGYSLGHFAWLNSNGDFTGIAQFLFNHIPGFTVAVYNNIQVLYAQWDFWILFTASLLPLPYKIFSISAGVFNVNIFIFSIATFVSQGVKFYLLAILIKKIGPQVKRMLQFNFKPIAIIATVCAAVTLVIIKIF